MANMSHYGRVGYQNGTYTKLSGSGNWDVKPVAGLPLGQIQIIFKEKITGDYGILVSAEQNPNAPLLAANYGRSSDKGFTVHLWETVADRTVMNSGFSFAVLPTG